MSPFGMQKARFIAAAGFAIACFVAALPADAKVQVKPMRVEETRVKNIQPPAANTFAGFPESLTVTVHLEGPELNGPATVAKVDVTQATDDTGKSLQHAERFPGLTPPPAPPLPGEKKEQGLSVTIPLETSARKASRIAVLKGSIQLHAGGQAKTVVAGKVKALLGKSVTDPALTAAKVNVKVIDPKASGAGFAPPNGDSLTVEVSGDTAALEKVEIDDASGQDVSNGGFSSESNGKKQIGVSMNAPLTDATTLKLHLIVGQKLLTVPLDLKDVPLP